MARIGRIFEGRFRRHSDANRRGKGTHAALDQLQYLAHRHRYVLRMDIVQHFPSLDHTVLRQAIVHVIEDADTRWPVDTILASGADVLAAEYDMVYFRFTRRLAFNRSCVRGWVNHVRWGDTWGLRRRVPGLSTVRAQTPQSPPAPGAPEARCAR